MALTREEKDEIAYQVGEEGFDIFWRSYTGPADFKDARFKGLVLDHLRACRDLAKYVGAQREVDDVQHAIRHWRGV